MDIENLLKALDNEENGKLINMTTDKIKKLNLEVLKELHLSKEDIIEYMKKLKGYMYVEDVQDLKHGSFIRWINIKDPDNLYLTNGGILAEIKVTDKGISIVCKSFSKRHYQIEMEESLIFQKLSGQEQVLLSALDHLSK
jgi:hypothetical protein